MRRRTLDPDASEHAQGLTASPTKGNHHAPKSTNARASWATQDASESNTFAAPAMTKAIKKKPDSLSDAALQPDLAPAPVTADLPDAVQWSEGMWLAPEDSEGWESGRQKASKRKVAPAPTGF